MKDNTQLSDKEFRRYVRNVCGFRITEHQSALWRMVWIPAIETRQAEKTEKTEKTENNGRLVFLGEQLMQHALSAFLYKKFPCSEAGFLTEALERISHHVFLSRLAQRLQIDYHAAHEQEDVLFLRDHINSDILKALVAAIYLCKGYDPAEKFILKQLAGQQENIREICMGTTNHKGKLIAWGQRNKSDIRFKLSKELKYNGKVLHVVSLFINNEWVANGCDTLIKNAEQHAAMTALESLNVNNDF